MKKPSKAMIIVLAVGILVVLGVAGWWWHSVCEEENARARAAAVPHMASGRLMPHLRSASPRRARATPTSHHPPVSLKVAATSTAAATGDAQSARSRLFDDLRRPRRNLYDHALTGYHPPVTLKLTATSTATR